MNRDTLNLDICELIGQRSKCERGKVGCLITYEHRIISSGYNGPVGEIDICKKLGCNIENKCQNSLHAEANAICFAAKKGIALRHTTLYCTHGPCLECAWMIKQAGIREVIFRYPYRNDEGVDFLIANHVIVRHKQ